MATEQDFEVLSDRIDCALETEDDEDFVVSFVPTLSQASLSSLRIPVQQKLLRLCLEGRLPASLAAIFARSCRRAGLDIPQHNFCISDALIATLENFPGLDNQEWGDLLVSYARAGNLPCFAVAVERSKIDLGVVDDLLNHAIIGGNPDVLAHALESGAPVNADGSDFLLAVRTGSLRMCQSLLKHGANPRGHAKASHWFPVNVWNYDAYFQVVLREPRMDDEAIVRLLQSHNVDINETPDRHLNLVAFAVLNERADLVPLFIELGAKHSLADLFQHRTSFDNTLLTEMIRSGHDLNAAIPEDEMGYAISSAAAWSSCDVLQSLLEMNVNVKVRGGTLGHTPLTAAIYGVVRTNGVVTPETEAKIKLLLSLCPSLATTSMQCGTYPWGVLKTYVFEARDRERIGLLLKANGASPTKLFSSDWLVRIYMHGGHEVRPDFLYVGLVKHWIQCGMDLSAELEGKTWADLLCRKDDVVEIFSVVTKLGARLRTNEQVLRVALQLCFGRGEEALESLIPVLPDINGPCGRDPRGREVSNLLSFAAANRLWPIFDIVLKMNPDVDLRDSTDLTALEAILVQYGHRLRPRAEALLAAGADVNAQDSRGRTQLLRSVCLGNELAVEWLLGHGADANIVDDAGFSPLDVAVFASHLSESAENVSVAFPDGGRWEFFGIQKCNARKRIRRLLGGFVQKPIARPTAAISFAADYGLDTLSEVLRQTPAKSKDSRLFGSGVVLSAHRQWLEDLRVRLNDGASLTVTEGYRGHTPLTASIAGWSVNGVESSASKTEVVAFLLSHEPRLAGMPTALGEYPIFFVYTCDLDESERWEISRLLMEAGAIPDLVCDPIYFDKLRDRYDDLGLRGPRDLVMLKTWFPLMAAGGQMDPSNDEMIGISGLTNGSLLNEIRTFYTTIPNGT